MISPPLKLLIGKSKLEIIQHNPIYNPFNLILTHSIFSGYERVLQNVNFQLNFFVSQFGGPSRHDNYKATSNNRNVGTDVIWTLVHNKEFQGSPMPNYLNSYSFYSMHYKSSSG